MFAALGLANGNVSCNFITSSTCPVGTAKLMGLQNDSGGFNGAHAQNFSLSTYSNSICCNSTNSSININNSCNMGSVVARLSNFSNAHLQAPNMTNYPVLACLNTSYQNITCQTEEASCSSGFQCVMSLRNSEGYNYTNAHAADCSTYNTKICCGMANSPPSAPVLAYPVNGNLTVFERSVNFTWLASSDPEGNSIYYTLNATCGASCTCPDINVGSLIGINYTHSQPLCFDVAYNWTATACDSYNACSTSSRWNFTIASVLDFVLISNSSDFGSFSQGQSKDTLSNSPSPLVGRNNGNVLVNATINATALFSAVAFDTLNYQFLAANNESSSLVLGCSQTAFNNMSLAQKNLLCNLSYVDSNDEARIDFNITVPADEGSGEKRSVIEILAVSSE